MNCNNIINKIIFRQVNENELDKVLFLYNEAKKNPFCVWGDEYPTMNEIIEDFFTNNLYVCVLDDKIISAISVVPKNEMDHIDVWSIKENVIEVARVVVSQEYSGNNIACFMMNSLIIIKRKENVKAIHLACQCDNIPSIKTYEKLNFKFIKKHNMYGHTYYLCELIL